MQVVKLPNKASMSTYTPSVLSETQSRRAALAAPLVLLGVSLAGSAQAVSAAKNGSTASKEGYTLQGPRKSGISSSRKAEIMKKLKEKIAEGS